MKTLLLTLLLLTAGCLLKVLDQGEMLSNILLFLGGSGLSWFIGKGILQVQQS